MTNKKTIAANTLAISFTIEKPLNFQAGQFFFLELKNPPLTDNRGNIRHFTIVNAPETNLEIKMATRLSDSAFKRSLIAMPIGSEVEITGPSGNFLLPDSQEIIMIAGGIGITPFMSQLNYIKNQKLNYQIILLYFNKNLASTAFYDELKQLEPELPNFRLVVIMSEDNNWPGEQGQINKDLIKKYSQTFADPTFMVVGPPAMTEVTLTELKALKIKNDKIRVENFTGYKN